MIDYGLITDAATVFEDRGLITDPPTTFEDWGPLVDVPVGAESALLEIADAVAAEINATTWDLTVTAERVLAAELELEALVDMRVLVVPFSEKLQRVTRGKRIRKCVVDIYVAVRLADAENATVDPYVNLLRDIGAHFNFGHRLTALPEAFVEKIEPSPIYDQRHLETRSKYTGVLRAEVADWR